MSEKAWRHIPGEGWYVTEKVRGVVTSRNVSVSDVPLAVVAACRTRPFGWVEEKEAKHLTAHD